MASNRTKSDTGYRKSVICTHPTTPTTGQPVRVGLMTGVALTDEGEGSNATGYTSVDFGPGEYDLAVSAVDDDGNSAIAIGDNLFYVDADAPTLSKKISGYFFGFAQEVVTTGGSDTIRVQHAPSPGSGSLASGGVTTVKIAAGAVDETKLKTNLAVGCIPLDITTVRIMSTNDVAATTEGGVPDSNTNPSLARVNGATDKTLRVAWAASNAAEIAFAPVVYPPDWDGTANASIHFLAAMAGTTDTPVLTVAAFEGVGDTDFGGTTGALTGTAVAEYTRTGSDQGSDCLPGPLEGGSSACGPD